MIATKGNFGQICPTNLLLWLSSVLFMYSCEYVGILHHECEVEATVDLIPPHLEVGISWWLTELKIESMASLPHPPNTSTTKTSSEGTWLTISRVCGLFSHLSCMTTALSHFLYELQIDNLYIKYSWAWRGTSLAIECLLVWIGLLEECHFLSQFVEKDLPCGRSQQCSLWAGCVLSSPKWQVSTWCPQVSMLWWQSGSSFSRH